MKMKEVNPTTLNINVNIFEEDLSIVIDELLRITFKDLNERKEEKVRKQHILDYINNCEIILQEIYYWLLNNQNDSNSIYLLGYFNYCGIGTSTNKQKAFELYQKVSDLNNYGVMLDLADICIHGEGIEKNHNKLLNYLKNWQKEIIQMQ